MAVPFRNHLVAQRFALISGTCRSWATKRRASPTDPSESHSIGQGFDSPQLHIGLPVLLLGSTGFFCFGGKVGLGATSRAGQQQYLDHAASVGYDPTKDPLIGKKIDELRVLDLSTLIKVKAEANRPKDRMALPILLATLDERQKPRSDA